MEEQSERTLSPIISSAIPTQNDRQPRGVVSEKRVEVVRAEASLDGPDFARARHILRPTRSYEFAPPQRKGRAAAVEPESSAQRLAQLIPRARGKKHTPSPTIHLDRYRLAVMNKYTHPTCPRHHEKEMCQCFQHMPSPAFVKPSNPKVRYKFLNRPLSAQVYVSSRQRSNHQNPQVEDEVSSASIKSWPIAEEGEPPAGEHSLTERDLPTSKSAASFFTSRRKALPSYAKPLKRHSPKGPSPAAWAQPPAGSESSEAAGSPAGLTVEQQVQDLLLEEEPQISPSSAKPPISILRKQGGKRDDLHIYPQYVPNKDEVGNMSHTTINHAKKASPKSMKLVKNPTSPFAGQQFCHYQPKMSPSAQGQMSPGSPSRRSQLSGRSYGSPSDGSMSPLPFHPTRMENEVGQKRVFFAKGA